MSQSTLNEKYKLYCTTDPLLHPSFTIRAPPKLYLGLAGGEKYNLFFAFRSPLINVGVDV